MSAVSIIAMKMSGATLSRSGSIDSFGEPPPGIEMDSTPPATMQSAPSERIELAGDEFAPERRIFLRVWCRKEACLKATGVGLVDDLTSVSVVRDRVDV